MYAGPKAWFALMDKLADMVITYLKAQINAGAKAGQIFDSWVGTGNVADYRVFIKTSMERIFAEVRTMGVPRIMHDGGVAHL